MTGILIIILFLPAAFSVNQSADLSSYEGQNVTLHCSQIGTSYNSMYWFRKRPSESLELIVHYYVNMGTPEDKFKQKVSVMKKGNSLDLTMKELESTDSAVYFCAKQEASGLQAYFGTGTKLTVLDNSIKITEPKRVSLLNVSENEVCTKTNVTLVCVAEGFYPDHVSVSWSVDGEKRETDVSTDEAAIQDVKTNFYSISSRLNINYKDEWTKGKEFTCTVSFFNGTVYTEHSDSYRSPKNLGENLVEKYIQSANVTMLAYGMFIGKSIAYGLFILYVIKRQGFISK